MGSGLVGSRNQLVDRGPYSGAGQGRGSNCGCAEVEDAARVGPKMRGPELLISL